MSVREDSAPLMILEYLPYGDLQGFLEKYRCIILQCALEQVYDSSIEKGVLNPVLILLHITV